MFLAGRSFADRALFLLALGIASSSITACSPKFNFNAQLSGNDLNSSSPVILATQLAFVTQPSAAESSGLSLATQPVVQVQDALGNPASQASNTITLAAYSDSHCTSVATGSLSATTNPVSASGGNASFSAVAYTGPIGTIYIGATSPGLTSVCSNAITVSAGSAAKLVFSTQPSNTDASGVALATQPVLHVEDSAGNLVTSSSYSITLSAYSDSSCSTAGSGSVSATTNPVSSSSGIANFSGVAYNGLVGTIYLGASALGLTTGCSNAITVSAGPPANLVWTTTPISPGVNGCEGVQIGVQDTGGNTATVTGSAVTVNYSVTGSAGFYSDSACTTAQSTASIAVGQTHTATMYFIDLVQEQITVGATSAPLTAAPNTTIKTLLHLNVTSWGQLTYAAGTCVGFTVSAQDNKGNTLATNFATGFSFSGLAGNSNIYTDSGCTTLKTYGGGLSVGQSSANYYTTDDRAETFTAPTSTSSPYFFYNGSGPGTVTVTANTPSAFVLTGPTFVSPGTCTPYTATVTDAYGNPTLITGSPLTVTLTPTGSAQFFSDSGCSASESSLSVAVGSSAQGFYAKDTATEIATLTASATSYTSGTFNLDSSTTSALQQVAIGAASMCALVGGGVKCWGDDSQGELGNGTTSGYSLAPVSVSGLSSGVQNLYGSVAGGGPFCVIKTDSTVWCWGNVNGSTLSTPTEIKSGGSPLLAQQLAMGTGTICAVTAAGALYCVGSGFGTITAPKLMASSGVIGTGLGVSTYCVILTGGDLKCWGGNANGQVGNGTTTTQAYAAQVTGLTAGIDAVVEEKDSSGTETTCSLNSSGAVDCWGSNNHGTMATGSTGSSSNTAPSAAIAPLNANVTSLAAGYGYFCAVLTSGALYCWGQDLNGDFGNGSTTMTTGTPQQIFSSGVSDVITSPGSESTCAIVSGNLECWGFNQWGQNANGTMVNTNVPGYSFSLE